MLRHILVILSLLLSCVPAVAEELLPRPPGLEPNVRFWTRIYTEVDGNSGLIHDSERLDVVYQELRFPSGLSQRARDRKVKKVKERVRASLKRLAAGKRTGLSAEDQTVLSRWPRDVSNATLRSAARNVRFQLGQADKFRAGLIRSGAWIDHIRVSLVEQGVPVELAALPHVESSYNPKAYSRIGAAGLWQFTRDTGRRYLRVDLVVDERMDPFKSTEAAARLLRDNHRSVQAWPLAITAYNHGAAGMRRAVQKLGTRDIDTIVRKYRSRTFGFASRNFYASFLAALEVDRNPEHYFGPLEPARPVEYTLVEMPHFYPAESVGNALGVNLGTLREHNSALRPAVWTGSKYVPRGFALRVPAELISEPPSALLARIPESERLAQQHRDRFYKVQRGDTLSGIARRFGVRESELVAVNNLRSRHRIRAGQVLVLPGTGPVEVRREEAPSDGFYRVRRGDTVSIIARRFGTSEKELAALNGLRDRNRIAVGQRLKIPGAAAVPDEPGEAPETPFEIASAQIHDAPAARAQGGPGTRAEADTREDSNGQPDAPGELEAADSFAAEAPAVERPETAPDDEGPAPEPSDYAIHANDRITVQAAETLGHYAEWLEVRASQLRAMNGLRYGQDLVIGRPLRLDLSRVAPEEFERRRLEYHRSLQEEFFDAYVVTGTERHILRRGDTIWELATREYRVPVWLLRQYNPDLDFAALPAGVAMIVPVIEPRSS
ncbi:MAG TPA: LysM peptidoglycan-binding domain-containing protein [Myxococcota bacterium]